MADFYVSDLRGDDAAGTGTAASPWKTIGRAIGSSPAVTLSGSGTDRVFVEPGVYYGPVTLGLSPSSGNPLEIVADCDGAGFLAGGYATPKVGLVEWWGWTDPATVSTSPALTISGKSHVTIDRFKICGGNTQSSNNGSTVEMRGGFANIVIRDCILVCHPTAAICVRMNEISGAANATIERCRIAAGAGANNSGLNVVYNEAASEFDINSIVRNCRFTGVAYGIRIYRNSSGPSGLGKSAMGLTIAHNTFSNLGTCVQHVDNFPLATPIVIRGNVFHNSTTGISAQNTSMFAEDWNVFACPTPWTNVTAGANSSTGVRMALNHGDERLTGLPLRPDFEPTAGSPLGGLVPSGFPTTDLSNRRRPEGLGSTNAAVGCLERHDTGVRNAVHQDSGSVACLELVGPSSHDRLVVVDDVPTTISVKVRWDGDHGDADKPRATILANPEAGVAEQTATATSTGGSGSTPNAYETLTFAPFTPSAPGAVMLRLSSRSATGSGRAYFDSIAVN